MCLLSVPTVSSLMLYCLQGVVQAMTVSAVCSDCCCILSVGCFADHDCFCCLFSGCIVAEFCLQGVLQAMIVSAVCFDCCCILSVGCFADHDCFSCLFSGCIVAEFCLQGVMKAALTGLYSVLERPQVLCGGGCWQTHLANYVRHEVSTWPLIYHE